MKRHTPPKGRNPVAYAMGLRGGDGFHADRRRLLLEEAAAEELERELEELEEEEARGTL